MTDLGEIDLLAEVAGVGGYEEVKKGSVVVKAYDRTFLALDLAGLIRAKRTAGKAKGSFCNPRIGKPAGSSRARVLKKARALVRSVVR